MSKRVDLREALLGTLTVALSLAVVPSAGAQESGETGAAARDEIVVTATRRAESLQDVPLSVSAINAERLENLGARDKADFFFTIPGVAFTDVGGGREEYIIRGISSLSSNATTAIYVDETPIPQTGRFSFDLRLFDIDRVEVLRGPQGTLFGASAMGGAIRTITNPPSFDGVSASFDASVSTTNEGGDNYDANIAVNVPLSDRVALRVVAFDERESGWVDNFDLIDDGSGGFAPGALIEENIGERRVQGARVALRADLSEALTATATYYYQTSEFDGINSEDELFGRESLRQARVFNEPYSIESQLVNLTVGYDLGWADLVSSSSYAEKTAFERLDYTRTFGDAVQFFNDLLGDGRDTSSVTPLAISEAGDETNFTQEVRLISSGDTRLQWIVGAFYSENEYEAEQIFRGQGAADFFGPLTPEDSLFEFRPTNKTEEVSIFGEVTYNFTDRLQATLGARRYQYTTSDRISQRGLFNFGGALEDITVGFSESNSSREDGFTYKALASYSFTDDILVYASASSGYRPGGPNGALPAGELPTPEAQFESDELWNYELGWKTQFNDGRVTLNGAIFRIDWSDIQTAVGTTSGFSFVTNAGEAEVTGLELEASALLLDNWSVAGAITLQNAEFRTDFADLGVSAGDPLPSVPEFNMSLNSTYEWSLVGDWRAFAFGQFTHVGERVENANQGLVLPAYERFDLRAGVRLDELEFSIFAENLTDERGLAGREDSNAGERRLYIQPRTIGISVRNTF